MTSIFDLNQNNPAHRSNRPTWLAMSALVAVVYASLFPFQFAVEPIVLIAQTNDFLLQLLEIPKGQLADSVGHFAVYAVLSALILASYHPSTKTPSRPMHGIGNTLLICFTLALVMELVQLTLHARGTSSADFYASIGGTLLGVLFRALLFRTVPNSGHRQNDLIRTLLLTYLGVYIFYSLLPFDFYFLREDLLQKYHSERFAWWIERASCGRFRGCSIKIALELLIAVPIGLMLPVVFHLHRKTSLILASVVFALVIELAQLFLASGYSQGISALMRLSGLLLGASVYHHKMRFSWQSFKLPPPSLLSILSAIYLLLALYANGLLGAEYQWHAISAHWQALDWRPFARYLLAGDVESSLSFAIQCVLYAPLGIVAFWLLPPQPNADKRSLYLCILLASTFFVCIEGLKLISVHKIADPSHLIIAWISAVSAYQIALRLKFTSLVLGTHTAPDQQSARLTVGALIGAAILLVASLSFGLTHPLSAPVTVLLASVYFMLLLRWPNLWLWMLPACLPILDLAPLTGRFYVDEFDLLMAITAIRFLLFPVRTKQIYRWSHGGLFNLFCLIWMVSALKGLLPLETLQQSTFYSYFTQYNALRVFKGIAWAWVFYALIRQGHAPFHKHSLLKGITLGMGLTLLICLIERILFPGLLDFYADYRITGLFSGMHIGGAYIDSYLVLSLPIFCYLLSRPQTIWWQQLAAWAAILLASYILYVTYSRTTYLAALISVLPLVGILIRRSQFSSNSQPHRSSWVFVVVLILGVSALFYGGGFIQQRLAKLPGDLATRQAHWQMVQEIKSSDLFSRLLGMGVGQYPLQYFWQGKTENRPGVVSTNRADSQIHLQLAGGSPVFFSQHIKPHEHREFKLTLNLRASTPGAHLSVYLCEKSYLFSTDCMVRQMGMIEMSEQWQKLETTLSLAPSDSALGSQLRDSLVPLSLGLVNAGRHSILEIQSVALQNLSGEQLIRNANFNQRTDQWFFTADNHWAWHIENLFLYFWFELGWVGLVIFLGLMAQLTAAAVGGVMAQQDDSLVVLGGLLGLLVIGLFNSPFDFPRILFLFALLSIYILAFDSRSSSNVQEFKSAATISR